MNDNIIISAISKIYFIIVSFLSFIFLTLSVVFILLQNGIYIDNIKVPNLQIKKLYIKWNEKLNISVQEIKISKEQEQKDTKIEYKQINAIFKQLILFDTWFEKIEIHKILFNEIDASFKYSEGESGFFNATAPNFFIKGLLYFDANLLDVSIEEFRDYKRNIAIDGDIILDLYSNNIEITSALNININNDVKLKLYTTATQEKLFYRVDSLKNITDIRHTIELFQLGQDINYWAIDAIDSSSVSIHDVYGWLEYKKLDQLYKNIYVSATVNDLKYTYNQQLDPIDSKHTELKFKDGIFSIYPKEAYTYGFYLNKSWVKLDFTKKEELVSIYLIFKGMLNKDVLSITRAYGIDLPFYQHKGVIDTNLQLDINLRTIDVSAKGDFFTKKANFDYIGLNINIFDAYITLNNTHVTIPDMSATYEDDVIFVKSKVDVDFNANNTTGAINFNVDKISFKDVDLALDKKKKPFHITYKMLEDQDIIEVERSFWNFLSKDVRVEPINIDFDADKLMLKIPKTLVKVEDMASAYIFGKTLLNPIRANFNIDFFKFNTKNIRLNQPRAQMQLIYDKKFTLFSDKKVRVEFNELEYILANTKVDIQNNGFDVKYCYLSLKDKIETKLNGVYNFETSKGDVNLSYLKIQNETLGEIFYNKKATKLHIDAHTKDFSVRSDEFDIDFLLTSTQWKLKLNNLNEISKKSKILTQYNIDDGNFSVYKMSNDKDINFFGEVQYPYEILVKDNVPLSKYTIEGKYDENISLELNKQINVDIDDKITINADNIGININDVLSFINDRNTTSTTKKRSNIILNATNSYIFIDPTRHIISDTMNLQYVNDITTAQLKHKDGSAVFELIHGKFHLYGENFSDVFMENLFALSKFKHGALAFSMNGTTSEYDGIFYVKDTTILEYKVLNNILAFVNTIPSLVTFSLPGYSKNGLDVSDGYMNFHAKDDEFEISDIYVKSKELTILGKGVASFKRNDINLRLNLKTDLGSAISQIPIVGYILLGDDTVATTLSITGPLDNPKVKSLIAEDIIVAPLNIIKRTFLLPYHLFSGD